MRIQALFALVLVASCVYVQGEGTQQFDGEIDPAAARGTAGEAPAAPAPVLSKSGLPEHFHRTIVKDGKEIWYPELFEGGADAKERAVMEWALNHSFIDGGISFQKSFGASGRGMVYHRDVKAGEEVLGVPIDIMIYTSNPHISKESRKALEVFREKARTPGMVAEDFELTEMALIVMFEKRNPESFFKAYLEQIQDPLCPAFYNDAELAKFEYPWIKTWRLYFLADSLRNFQKLIEEPEMAWARSATAEYEFLWAVSTVLQRSFDWGPDTRREYVMVPILDMVNHRKNVQNNYYYSSGPFTRRNAAGLSEQVEAKRGMVLGTDADHKAGEEIYISYSMTSNSIQLLLQYGFVESDNEHDYVILSVPEPKDAELSAKLEELGPVISVGKDGIVSTSFYRAVNYALERKADVTAKAVETVLKYVQRDMAKFSTSLEEDQATLKTATLDRAGYSAVAYRVEAKKNLKAIIAHVTADLAKVQKGEALPETQSTSTKLDWPVRFIRVGTQEMGITESEDPSA